KTLRSQWTRRREEPAMKILATTAAAACAIKTTDHVVVVAASFEAQCRPDRSCRQRGVRMTHSRSLWGGLGRAPVF
ncbi:hypothetical protein ACLKA6_001454, partial [Drosophila palustris]